MQRIAPCLLVLASLGAARAQPARIDAVKDVTCRTTPGFVVVARPLSDEIGFELYARARARPDEAVPCTFAPGPEDLRLGGPDRPYEIQGMNGRFLAVTELAGMAGTLKVFDLSTGKAVVSEPLTEANQTQVSGDRISFTIRSGPATAKTCRSLAAFRKDGGSGEIGVPATVDLATGALDRGPKTVCTYAQ